LLGVLLISGKHFLPIDFDLFIANVGSYKIICSTNHCLKFGIDVQALVGGLK
jgi:hypothetical protein